MFKVAIVGHSLVPTAISCPSGVSCQIFRKPGGCFSDEDCSEFRGLWQSHFDLVIVFLGGNDLVQFGEIDVYNKARRFIDRVSSHANLVRVCNVEHRAYPESSFRVSVNSEYKRKRNAFNRKLVRYLRRNGHVMLDVGRPVFYNNRVPDGVHFSLISKVALERYFVRVISGAYRDRRIRL